MKKTINYIEILLLLVIVLVITSTLSSCNTNDDGSTTTENTDEYFRYTIDGVERIFDEEVEGHLETETDSPFDRFEIYARGRQPDGLARTIAGSLAFRDTEFFPTATYNWGIMSVNNTVESFFFTENTPSNFFAISADFNTNPIVATMTSAPPTNVGDYLEFTFTGTYQDDFNVTHTISGECRVQRDQDQNY